MLILSPTPSPNPAGVKDLSERFKARVFCSTSTSPEILSRLLVSAFGQGESDPLEPPESVRARLTKRLKGRSLACWTVGDENGTLSPLVVRDKLRVDSTLSHRPATLTQHRLETRFRRSVAT